MQAPMAAPWVILRRCLGLVPKEAEAERPVPISVALREPPRVTVLDVSPSVRRDDPRPIRSDKLPYLVATGPGVLLVCFSFDEVPIVTDDLILVRNFVSPADPLRQPTTGSPDLVPRRTGPSMPVSYNVRSVGLTSALFGGYLIAELLVTRSSDRAKLLRLFSLDDRWFPKGSLFSRDDQWNWTETDLPCPLPTRDGTKREWCPSGVVDHDKKLWWFDLSWGLISCDPNAVEPVLRLRFHYLPPGRFLAEAKPFIHTIRCVSVSNHMLRYVDIARDLDLDGRVAERKVSVWTAIPDPDCGDGDHGIRWLKTYEMGFKEIWNDASYRETQLPAKIPEIVLVHPKHPNVVYFFLRRSLFGVDVPAHRVVWFVMDAHKLVAPGCRRCVLPWDLPASIANGIVDAVVPSRGERGLSSTTPGASSSGVGHE
ncbi:hypothetical protein PAHAL_4G232300 [Panicum hallii]|uniref:DUF1618 domain-containing protein n=1 Tax=Panicum hallii TaxID=206008 RepID=A0A2S3HJN3_9POAL|nr:hypothetical protein PAHAL_4G232300 [Panicum hallii]